MHIPTFLLETLVSTWHLRNSDHTRLMMMMMMRRRRRRDLTSLDASEGDSHQLAGFCLCRRRASRCRHLNRLLRCSVIVPNRHRVMANTPCWDNERCVRGTDRSAISNTQTNTPSPPLNKTQHFFGETIDRNMNSPRSFHPCLHLATAANTFTMRVFARLLTIHQLHRIHPKAVQMHPRLVR